MCGCHDCKRHNNGKRNPNIIIDWTKIPDKFNWITIDGCSGEIWLSSDKMCHSVTSQGGKWMPHFPIHHNEVQTMIGHVTQTPDGKMHAIGHANEMYGIEKLQIGVKWSECGEWYEHAIANRPCKSRS